MTRGMTGFGSAQVSSEKIKAVLEVKSLNHRYLDINYYLPIGFNSVENKIRTLVQKSLQRGRVTISVKITKKPTQSIAINREAIKQYVQHTRSIKREFGFKGDVGLSDIIKLPGVIEARESLVSPDELWPHIEKCLKRALVALIAMRKREGRSLAIDIKGNLSRMSLQINKIQKRSVAVLKDQKRKLSSEEFSSFQRGCDINEEISRMQHYIVEMKRLLKSNQKSMSVGKRIDFIAQEMQRETNTIGSKMQDKVVSNAVIALKSKIEKIREQSQNIE